MSEIYDADKETFMGVPRKEIPWWPIIDYNKCNFCMECDKFCKHNVYTKIDDEKKKLIVESQYNCVVFCRACAKTCAPDALIFPDKREITNLIKKLRSKNK